MVSLTLSVSSTLRSDDVSQWDLIKSYTDYTFEFGQPIAFPPQRVGAGQTRAFYIAIVDTHGQIRPLQSGLKTGGKWI